MSAHPTADDPPGPAAAGFREALRRGLAALGPDAARGWARSGHLPGHVIADLGRPGIFRDRWADGAAEGAALVVAMAQETAAVSSGLALAVMGHCEVFCGALHWLARTPGQAALREAALDGAIVGCLGSTEPAGGSALASIRTAAIREEGGWRLRGRKSYISNLGGASHILVLARPGDGLDPADLSLFIVPLEAPGVSVDGYFPAMGLEACDVGQVSLDTALPADAMLGMPGMGVAYLSRLLQFERLSICAQVTAGANAALGLAAAFARRRAIGAERLIDKQAVRHRLARCQSQLWLIEAALRDLVARTEAGRGVGHETAALKLEASRVAGEVSDACLQVFGARGYLRSYPLEGIWRDVRLARIGGGSEEVMTDLIASRLDRPDQRRERELDELEAGNEPVPDPLAAPAR
jgi:alkylation response protein AidB-like acyl-CoA dehydrogenase